MHAVAEEKVSTSPRQIWYYVDDDDNAVLPIFVYLWLMFNSRMAGLTFNKKMQGQLAARKFIIHISAIFTSLTCNLKCNLSLLDL